MEKNSKVIILGIVVIVLILGIFIYFKNNTYEVIFYSDGEIYETINVHKNRPMNRPEQPTKEGYVFLGWYDETGETWNFSNNVSKNMALVAHWGQISNE